MTNYIILALCSIILIAYLFDLSGRFSKIPGVLLLILMGMGIRIISAYTGFVIPNLRPVLPVIGTLGLIMIVMEASLDIHLKKEKKGLLVSSVSSALILLLVFTGAFSFILVNFFGTGVHDSLVNAIPLGIISSSIAIPSAATLNQDDREFVVYESSFSDIFGIMLFDLVLINETSIGAGLFTFIRNGLLTVIIALISTGLLGYLLHRSTFHVNYVIILTFIVLIYSLAKLIHLPALLVILIFGLVLANTQFIEIDFLKRFFDFQKFRGDIGSFKKILGELTFLVRSFFFIMFGYYTPVYGLFSINNLLTGLLISAGILFSRWLFFRHFLRTQVHPLVFFAPRGLITILLFLSIPEASRIPLISGEVVTIVMLTTIILMTVGSITRRTG